MDYLEALVITSSAYSGFMVGCLFYKYSHLNGSCSYTSKYKTRTFETIYGLVGVGCFLATQQGCLNMYKKFKNKN
jgi:hypothetical protein